MKNQEVIKYAYGLTEQKEELLDFVYKTLINYILRQMDIPESMFDSEAAFLSSLLKELSENDMDPLHNKYINYITKRSKIFIPSQVYVFGPAKYKHIDMSYKVEKSSSDPAQSIIKLCSEKPEDNQDILEVLKILGHIGKHQQVFISHFDLKYVSLPEDSDSCSVAKEVLKISRKLTSIRTFACKLPAIIFEHIVGQLQNCDNLRRLDLGECESMDIAKAVSASSSLTELYLYKCKISTRKFQKIARQLVTCNGLQKLHLNYTKNVPRAMGTALIAMESLKEFYAKGCGMAKHVSQAVLKSLSLCHGIEDLRLPDNELTDCLQYLFGDNDHPGFTSLNRLWINNTKLSENDIGILSAVVGMNKVPCLAHLSISDNKMTGLLRGLFCGENHPGFPYLKSLNLSNVQLNPDDLNSIRETIAENRIPHLRQMFLDGNNFLSMMAGVENLVRKCKEAYTKLNVMLFFSPNLVQLEFFEEMKKICAGTEVRVWKWPNNQ